MAATKIRVGLVKGEDRYGTVSAALAKIEDQVQIPDKPVVVKVNFVWVDFPLCATHVDATRATLDFLKGKGVERFIVAEGPANGPIERGLDNYGYRALADEYDVTFLDLNTDTPVLVPAFDSNLNRQELKIAKTLTESYVVSVAPMKTHNDVVVTMGLKNILVGMLCGSAEKQKIHQDKEGRRAINLTLAKLAQHVAPDLAVIDGTTGMQGNGPVNGFAIDSRMALASAHAIAADVIGLQAMGFRLEQVGYLRYAMELRGLTLDDIEVVGNTIDECRIDFQPHDNIASQLNWSVEGDWRQVFDRVG
ncbi:MAG: DUF362 domain-containing protein [Dehalococcoidia bacterium]